MPIADPRQLGWAISDTAADRLGYSNAMPKPDTPADSDHQATPVPSIIIATPAPQIHMPHTIGFCLPMWSESLPVKNCEPPHTKPYTPMTQPMLAKDKPC